MISRDTLLYAVPVLSGLLLLNHYQGQAAKRKAHHPPSPKSFPLLGNLLSIPSGLEHEAYMKLGQQLNSDIIYLKLFGHSIIVLNSAQAASDLLDKRSALYSDRYCPPMVKEPTLLNWSSIASLVGYNDLWRHYRRMMKNWMSARAVAQFQTLQERQTHSLLKRLLDASTNPEPFDQVRKEFFHMMASSMFELAYGYHLKSDDDPFFTNAQQTIHNVSSAAMFTNFFVNIFPALTYFPDWFPGIGWKRTAREWRELKDRAINEPYEWTKSQIAAGTAEPSVLSILLQDHNLTADWSPEEKESRLKELAITMYGAGTDTSASVFGKFLAAMVLNPEVQARAQHELDTVLGPLTLPTMEDRERLPYINNLILEMLRWHPVVPTGIPHACFQDDTYRGYKIEKGTIVIGNIWAMSRDPNTYKDPETFNPDRFLDPNVPQLPAFGWGRRKCPGIYFGEASVFIGVASLLAAFTFSKKRNERGEEIEPKIEGSSNSVIFEIKPFEFEFRPRSEKHRQLVLENA